MLRLSLFLFGGGVCPYCLSWCLHIFPLQHRCQRCVFGSQSAFEAHQVDFFRPIKIGIDNIQCTTKIQRAISFGCLNSLQLTGCFVFTCTLSAFYAHCTRDNNQCGTSSSIIQLSRGYHPGNMNIIALPWTIFWRLVDATIIKYCIPK